MAVAVRIGNGNYGETVQAPAGESYWSDTRGGRCLVFQQGTSLQGRKRMPQQFEHCSAKSKLEPIRDTAAAVLIQQAILLESERMCVQGAMKTVETS